MLYSGPLLYPLMQLSRVRPGCIVLHKQNGFVTAKELLQKSIHIAATLQAKGFKHNDTAVLAAKPGEELLEIMYALIMLKGKIAIIDPEMGKENYASKMKQLRPQWMFIDSRLLLLQEHPFLKWLLLKFKRTLPDITLLNGTKLVTVGRQLPIFQRHVSFQSILKYPLAATPELFYTPGSSESVIVYTSGTLQIPKGVIHTARSLEASIVALGKLFDHNSNAIVGAYLPHFLLLGIAAGLPVKLMDPALRAKAKISWLKKESVGILFGPPSDYLPMIQYCETNNKVLPDCLQHIMIGSAPVHTLFLKRLINVLPGHTKITCTYGMTENLLVATIDGRQKALYSGKGDIVGKLAEGVSIAFARDGEILVKSSQLFCRYYHEESGNEWHATGDLGTTDEEGNIILLGRKKQMIIRGNMNIYPALYENTIKHIKGIDEAALVGIYCDNIHDEKLYLALEGSDINVRQVKKQLAYGRHSIDTAALPDKIIKMNIPRKGRQQKIDRAGIIEYIKKNGL
jgi:long-subunit acyl-CoA synthetase (AMP-forming)